MTLQLWGQEIQYDEKVVSLVEFSSFLEQRAKRSAEDFLRIGVKKKIGWLNDGTEFLEAEMRRACDDIGVYITQHNILGVPNWNMYLEPWVALAESSKVLMKNLHYSLINECNNEVQERANQAYRQSLASSEGLGFGIISSSLAAHLVYAVQSAQKEAENERAAQAAAEAVRRNSDVIGKAGELTTKAYHETHEPFVLETLTSFYDNVESFIYTGAGYSKSVINEQAKAATEIAQYTTGDIRGNIILALKKDICCGEVILAAIAEKLVDDGFVDFCKNAPIILLRKSVKPIVEWLSKEKRTNQLYNRPVFSEKIQAFLVTAQKLFLCGDANKHTLYESILSEVFADEINGTYSACYDLLNGKAIVEKYANNGTHISLSNTTVNMLVTLCNQIRSNRVVDLVRTAGLTLPLDAKQIVSLQEETNIAISNRSHEIMCAKAEAAAKAAAEKAEKDRIAAEARVKKQEADARKRQQNVKRIKITAAIILPVVALCLVCTLWLFPYVIRPAQAYKEAEALLEYKQYEEAIEAFQALGNYKDSPARVAEVQEAINATMYAEAEQFLALEQYYLAILKFQELGDYRDSPTRVIETQEAYNAATYAEADRFLTAGHYETAIKLFQTLGNYKDSVARVTEATNAMLDEKYCLAEELLKSGKYEEAILAFEQIKTYKDSANRITEAENLIKQRDYEHADSLYINGDLLNAAIAFEKLKDYSDAKERCIAIWRSIVPTSTIASSNSISAAVIKNGTVVTTPYTGYQKDMANTSQWTDVISVAIGSFHTLGLKSDGTVVATGGNTYGTLDVETWENVVQIAAGTKFSMALFADGTVRFASDDYGFKYDTWENIRLIYANGPKAIGIKFDGTVIIEADDHSDDCDCCAVSSWRDIVAVASSDWMTVGVKSNGTVITTNKALSNAVSAWRNIIAVGVCGTDTIVGLTKDGSIVVASSDPDRNAVLFEAEKWDNIVAIATGYWHIIGLKEDGTVVATPIVEGSKLYPHDEGQCEVTEWKNVIVP